MTQRNANHDKTKNRLCLSLLSVHKKFRSMWTRWNIRKIFIVCLFNNKSILNHFLFRRRRKKRWFEIVSSKLRGKKWAHSGIVPKALSKLFTMFKCLFRIFCLYITKQRRGKCMRTVFFIYHQNHLKESLPTMFTEMKFVCINFRKAMSEPALGK